MLSEQFTKKLFHFEFLININNINYNLQHAVLKRFQNSFI